MKWRRGSIAYLGSLAAADATRVDLDGHTVEPVTDAHRAGAERVLAAIRAQGRGASDLCKISFGYGART